MDAEFWNAVASAASTYAEGQESLDFPCVLRIAYKQRRIHVSAVVGKESITAVHNIVADLESRGFRVLGYGRSETRQTWGVVVEPRKQATGLENGVALKYRARNGREATICLG